MAPTPDELKKEREALIANHDTEQMTALTEGDDGPVPARL